MMINKGKSIQDLRISIFEANLFYLFVGLLLLIVGSYVQKKEIFLGLIITEYLIILVPCIFFLKIKGLPFRRTLKLNPINIKQVLLIIGITIFTYPLAVLAQGIFVMFLNDIKEVTPTALPLPRDGFQFIIGFLILALSPGICEEVMFRGLLLSSYEKIGPRKSIIIIALLFGIFHFTILNFIGPTILGIIFGIMVHKTNSLYSSILGHTVNNTIALAIGYYMNRYQQLLDKMMIDDIIYNPPASSEIRSLVIAVLFFICCIYFVSKMLNELEMEGDGVIKEGDYREGFNEEFPFEYYNLDYDSLEASFENYPIHENPSPNSVLDKLKYIPVLAIVIIFIMINWFNFFL